MWDKVSDYLLSAKHDPLTIGSGEVGFTDNRSDTSTEVSRSLSQNNGARNTSSPKKRKATSAVEGFDELSSLMSSVVSTCKELANPIPPTPPSKKQLAVSNIQIQNLPLDDLYKLLAQHCEHLAFLKQCDMCDDKKRKKLWQGVNLCLISLTAVLHPHLQQM